MVMVEGGLMEMEMKDINIEEIDEKRERTLLISDTAYKVLCMADHKNYDPSVGVENLAMMYASLAGPLNFEQFDLERARKMAQALFLTKDKQDQLKNKE